MTLTALTNDQAGLTPAERRLTTNLALAARVLSAATPLGATEFVDGSTDGIRKALHGFTP